MRFTLPSAATIALAAVLTVVVALNAQVFHFGHPWTEGISLAAMLLGLYGVSVMTGTGFQAVVQLPPNVLALVGVGLAGVQLVVHQAGASLTVRTVAECVLVAGAALGFEPAAIPVVGARAGANQYEPVLSRVTGRRSRASVAVAALVVVAGVPLLIAVAL